jgi:hypothetical protein
MCNCTDNPETENSGTLVPQNTKGYSMYDKVKNLARGIADNIKREFVSNEVYLERQKKCKVCPHRMNFVTGIRNPDRVEKADVCTLCNCSLKVDLNFAKGKLWLRNQECPRGDWGKDRD